MCRSGAGMSWYWVCLPETENSNCTGTVNVLVSTDSHLFFPLNFVSFTQFTEQRSPASCLCYQTVLIFSFKADFVLLLDSEPSGCESSQSTGDFSINTRLRHSVERVSSGHRTSKRDNYRLVTLRNGEDFCTSTVG